MKVLGIITARGGSKRIPGKNLAELGGRPLIAWTIGAALASCDRVIVTTDDMQTASAAYAGGVHAVINRPPELCGDDVPSLPVVRHAAETQKDITLFDIVALLQPTSPFRLPGDVTAAVELFQQRRALAVVSVVPFVNQNALFSVAHDTDRMRPWSEPGTIFTPNGAIYLIDTGHLLNGGDWYPPTGAYGYVMPPERSLDIDTHSDLDAARVMAAKITSEPSLPAMSESEEDGA